GGGWGAANPGRGVGGCGEGAGGGGVVRGGPPRGTAREEGERGARRDHTIPPRHPRAHSTGAARCGTPRIGRKRRPLPVATKAASTPKPDANWKEGTHANPRRHVARGARPRSRGSRPSGEARR